MSYLVFARKWRPQTFEEVVGQEHIMTTLKNAILQNRVAHAYLFSGPRGVGKTTTARILAKALNCQSADGPTPAPCNRCESCVEITEGRSLDVIEIDGASNRGIDEIRQLRENVKFSPSKGRYKVYIIDEVHQITPDGFNALLKTLEEPPAHVKFVFATTHRHKVIPTILSRCQRFDFKRVPVAQLVEKLKGICASEKLNIEEAAFFAIARSADGSVRDAESILDQLASFSHGNIKSADVTSLLGSVEQEALFEITRLIKAKDAGSALGLVNKFLNEGKDIFQFVGGLIEHFRNLAIAKVKIPPAGFIDLSKDAVDLIVEQSRDFSLADIIYLFNVLNNVQEMMHRSGFARIQLEVAIIKLANRDLLKDAPLSRPSPPVASFGASVSLPVGKPSAVRENFSKNTPLDFQPSADSNIGPATAVASASVETKTDAPALGIEEVRSAWPEVLQRVKSEKISAALFLMEGKPCGINGRTLSVNFPPQFVFYKEALERAENRAIIEKYLKEVLTEDINIRFSVVDDPQDAADKQDRSQPPQPPAGARQARPASIAAGPKSAQNGDLLSEPIVKAAVDIFRGRIVRK